MVTTRITWLCRNINNVTACYKKIAGSTYFVFCWYLLQIYAKIVHIKLISEIIRGDLMGSNDFMGKIKGKYDNITELIKKEHVLHINEERINHVISLDTEFKQKLEEDGIKNTNVKILEDNIEITGDYNRNSAKGTFKVDMQPAEIIWEEDCHKIYFYINDADVNLEGKVKNVLAKCVSTIFEIFSGESYFQKYVRSQFEDGKFLVDIDKMNPKAAAAANAVNLNEIECLDGKLALHISLRPEGLKTMASDGTGLIYEYLKSKVT